MLACPECGSEDVNLLEISEVDEDSTYECEDCEDCDHQFPISENVGGSVD